MNHINSELLYRLAELSEEGLPFNEEETQAMLHLAECVPCFEQYCALRTMLETMSETGRLLLGEWMEERAVKKASALSARILAAVSVSLRRLGDSLSVKMEQTREWGTRFSFEPPPVLAARGAHAEAPELSLLEDVNNERNRIVIDPETRELLVQLDLHDLDGTGARVFLLFEDESKTEVPLQRVGASLRGGLALPADKAFQLRIEQSEA